MVRQQKRGKQYKIYIACLLNKTTSVDMQVISPCLVAKIRHSQPFYPSFWDLCRFVCINLDDLALEPL